VTPIVTNTLDFSASARGTWRAEIQGVQRRRLLCVISFLAACNGSASGEDATDPVVGDTGAADVPDRETSTLDDGATRDTSVPDARRETDALVADDATPPPPARGAAVPWTEYEAEDGVTTGELLGPSRAFGELATESSGRRAVKLSTTGESVKITTKRAANSIVVRYAIPDAPSGGGLAATLSLYVDSVHRKDLALTSRYAWIYGGEAGSSNDDPKAGGGHHFFDETRALIGDVPVGATIELRKEAKDAAAWYAIDLVDLELVAPAAPKPGGALSIVDYGAIADDDRDDGLAIAKCIAAARAAKAEVWIPPGTFHSTTGAIDVASVTIRGAGMWHSTLRGLHATFRCTGDGCIYRDFSILGETTFRDDASPESGFLGGAGKGSLLENVWVEHTKTGYWVSAPTDGLIIRGCRFRDLFADGVNFCNGTSNSIVEHSHARNTGDDAFAAWSPSFDGGPDMGNVFRFDSVQLPWRANCFAIYGGKDARIEDSTCADVVEYPGVLLAQQFDAHPFAGTTVVQRVTLTRAGGPMWGQQHGALKLQASQADMRGFAIRDVDIVDATFSGIHLQGPHRIDDVTFSGVHVSGSGTVPLLVDGDGLIYTRGPGNTGW
jgi:hypothetical protein